jgi:hypothetical protein
VEQKVFLIIFGFIVAGLLVGCWQGPVITGPVIETSEALDTAPSIEEPAAKVAEVETQPAKAEYARTEEKGAVKAAAEVAYAPWYALGPFYNITFEQVIGPENGPDLTKEYEQDTPFKYRWKLHPEWKDGASLDLKLPAKSCMYFYRIAKVSEAGAAEFTVGTGDGIQVWVNRKEVFKRFEVGNANTEKVTTKLREGMNTILLKVYNEDSASELYFEN